MQLAEAYAQRGKWQLLLYARCKAMGSMDCIQAAPIPLRSLTLQFCPSISLAACPAISSSPWLTNTIGLPLCMGSVTHMEANTDSAAATRLSSCGQWRAMHLNWL